MKLGSQEVYAKKPFSDYYDIVPSETTELRRLHYKIMASHMYAFMLKDRTYGKGLNPQTCIVTNFASDLLDVTGLEQPAMAETAMDKLVMETSNKELIKAIAKIYTDRNQSTRFSADFLHGKGEGQIILLHGPPGTGKTLTAGKLNTQFFKMMVADVAQNLLPSTPSDHCSASLRLILATNLNLWKRAFSGTSKELAIGMR